MDLRHPQRWGERYVPRKLGPCDVNHECHPRLSGRAFDPWARGDGLATENLEDVAVISASAGDHSWACDSPAPLRGVGIIRKGNGWLSGPHHQRGSEDAEDRATRA